MDDEEKQDNNLTELHKLEVPIDANPDINLIDGIKITAEVDNHQDHSHANTHVEQNLSRDIIVDELVKVKAKYKCNLNERNVTVSNNICKWTNKNSTYTNQFELSYSESMNNFIVDFIKSSIEDNCNVSFSKTSKNKLSTLSNSRNNNLLMQALLLNVREISKELLNEPFDLNQRNNLGEIAADIALQQHNYDIFCCILERNSPFPRGFNSDTRVMNHERIKRIVQASTSIRLAIEEDDKDAIIKILDQNPHLIYFYDTNNQSAAAKAVKERKFDTYNLLLSKGRCIGPFEDVNTILGKLERDQKHLLREFHSKHAKVPERHITTILANCVVSHDDQNAAQRNQIIYELLKEINEQPFGNYLLQLIAAYGNFRIFFDFNRSSVQHMDPFGGDKNTDGLFYQNGHIYIGAQELLYKTERRVVKSSLVHEMCHFALLIIFNNDCKPYAANDDERKTHFEAIIQSYKLMNHDEKIISWVYECTPENSYASELIVRPPQLMSFYQNEPDKLAYLRTMYKDLFDFFESCVIPQLINIIPVLEELSKDDSKITFNQLTEPLKDKIMQVIVDFQGESIKLEEISDQTSKDVVLASIKPSQMLAIINNEQMEIQIGKSVRIDVEEMENYIEQEFIDAEVDISDENMEHGLWKHSVINNKQSIEDIVTETSKNTPFILSDMAGAGKTTAFKHICKKLKEKYPQKWISYVDLKRYLNVYKKYEEKFQTASTQSKEQLAVDILRGILNIDKELDAALFLYLYNHRKVILLFDGLDEISPKYNEFFISLIQTIKSCSGNQILIATRPHHTKELQETLQVPKVFKLLPWDKNSQKEFIKNTNIHLETKDENFLIYCKKMGLHNITNPLLMTMITKNYENNCFDEENSNIFSVYETVVRNKLRILNEEKGAIANADRDYSSTMTIWQIHQVYALKSIFLDDMLLNDLRIMKMWNHEKYKWSPDMISRYGLFYVDNWDTKNESSHFVLQTVAEFFAARYLTDHIEYAMNKWNYLSQEEIDKNNQILSTILQSPEEYKSIKSFLSHEPAYSEYIKSSQFRNFTELQCYNLQVDEPTLDEDENTESASSDDDYLSAEGEINDNSEGVDDTCMKFEKLNDETLKMFFRHILLFDQKTQNRLLQVLKIIDITNQNRADKLRKYLCIGDRNLNDEMNIKAFFQEGLVNSLETQSTTPPIQSKSFTQSPKPNRKGPIQTSKINDETQSLLPKQPSTSQNSIGIQQIHQPSSSGRQSRSPHQHRRVPSKPLLNEEVNNVGASTSCSNTKPLKKDDQPISITDSSQKIGGLNPDSSSTVIQIENKVDDDDMNDETKIEECIQEELVNSPPEQPSIPSIQPQSHFTSPHRNQRVSIQILDQYAEPSVTSISGSNVKWQKKYNSDLNEIQIDGEYKEHNTESNDETKSLLSTQPSTSQKSIGIQQIQQPSSSGRQSRSPHQHRRVPSIPLLDEEEYNEGASTSGCNSIQIENNRHDKSVFKICQKLINNPKHKNYKKISDLMDAAMKLMDEGKSSIDVLLVPSNFRIFKIMLKILLEDDVSKEEQEIADNMKNIIEYIEKKIADQCCITKIYKVIKRKVTLCKWYILIGVLLTTVITVSIKLIFDNFSVKVLSFISSAVAYFS